MQDRPPVFVVNEGKWGVRLIPSFSASYGEITKPGERMGAFELHVGTGRYDRSRLNFYYAGTGRTGIPATADGVRKFIRRIRPQELARLAEIDAQIAELERQRNSLVKEAWAKGHVVTLTEVKEKADALQSKRKAHA